MPKNRKLAYKLLTIVSFVTFFINSGIVFADPNTDNYCPDYIQKVAECPEYPCTAGYIVEILGMIKIVIPILLILLGTIDFVKAMVAQSDDKMKKAQSDVIKRVIIGVVIFFVPMILRFILNLFGPEFINSCTDAMLRF